MPIWQTSRQLHAAAVKRVNKRKLESIRGCLGLKIDTQYPPRVVGDEQVCSESLNNSKSASHGHFLRRVWQ